MDHGFRWQPGGRGLPARRPPPALRDLPLVPRPRPPYGPAIVVAARLAASASVELAEQITELQAAWFERAGRPRAVSAAAKIIWLLPPLPVLSAPTARVAVHTSQQKTLVALKGL